MSILPNMQIILDSFGWAVLHSIWQGALAAAFVWTSRAVTEERSAGLRYILGFGALCAMLVSFIATFAYYYGAHIGLTGGANNAGETLVLTRPFPAQSASANPLMLLTHYTYLIGTAWALCTAILGARYLSAYRQTRKLRTLGLTALPSDWQSKFTLLAQKSGLGPRVAGYISEYVSSPITLGFFKPVVLVPAWFFTTMSPEQCEAVLLHEFAHIRRHDYLTNIIQIIIKTVLFYHPATAYISKSINEDREHACDDFAAQINKDPQSLALALAAIRLKAARSGGVFALAADGPDSPLIHRLKRLIGPHSETVRADGGRAIAAMALAAGSALLLLVLGTSNSFAHPVKAEPVELAGAPATLQRNVSAGTQIENDRRSREVITVHGQTYWADAKGVETHIDVTSENGKPANYVINGKTYPSKYSYSLFSKDGESYVVKSKHGKRYMEINGSWHKVNARPVSPVPPVRPETQSRSINVDEIINQEVERAVEIALSQTGQNYDSELAHELRQSAREAAIESRAEIIEFAKEQRELAKEIAIEARAEAREHAVETREHARESARETRAHKSEARAREGRRRADDKQRERYMEMRDRLLPALKADGYLPRASSEVVFEMDKDDIFINGAKLPRAMEGKYCKIISDYIKRKDDTKRIVIKPDYLHISIDEQSGGKTRYTYTEK